MRHAYIDEHSQINSLIHKLDPRIKIISFILLVLSITLSAPNSWVSFALYGLLIIILVLLSNLPVEFIFKKTLVLIPFVLMVSIFIPFTKKGEILATYSQGALRLSVTYEGLMSLVHILIKAYLSILCMILLTSTTKFAELLKALGKLKFPTPIIMILSFMYRYIFVVQDELMKMKQAKGSRSIGGSGWFHFRVLANMIGVLFIRAYERAEFVYLAMCARGFSASIKTMSDSGIVKKDAQKSH